MTTPTFPSPEHQARAQLLRLAEPEDLYTALLIELFGPLTTLALLRGQTKLTPAQLEEATQHIEAQKLIKAIEQRTQSWRKRTEGLSPDGEARFAQTLGAWFCTPDDEDWPTQLADLGGKAPYGLWGRGDRSKLSQLTLDTSVAIVGSRDTTAYGSSATAHISGDLAQAGASIISGGAFGIDAQAHRSALSQSTSKLPTVALMAGGLDRLYPKANDNLLTQIIASGLLLSEVPLGYSPTRWRFLQRNRLIAALAHSTLVIEARWRSGALNTAHHALEIGRALYALPGPIFNPTSEGCHRLIKDGLAQLCTDAATIHQPQGLFTPETETRAHTKPTDQLTDVQARTWDALPLHRYGTIDQLATIIGIDPRTTMQTLSQLKTLGMAQTNGVGWKKHP